MARLQKSTDKLNSTTTEMTKKFFKKKICKLLQNTVSLHNWFVSHTLKHRLVPAQLRLKKQNDDSPKHKKNLSVRGVCEHNSATKMCIIAAVLHFRRPPTTWHKSVIAASQRANLHFDLACSVRTGFTTWWLRQTELAAGCFTSWPTAGRRGGPWLARGGRGPSLGGSGRRWWERLRGTGWLGRLDRKKGKVRSGLCRYKQV